MKHAAILVVILALAIFVSAQTQTPPAPAGTAATTPPPQGKRPPQAKTQPEFDAYKAATAQANDAAALEKAADDFAAKYPDSELRILLYRTAMHDYQTANNPDKMMEMGRKVLKIDPDDPEALVGVAQVLAERTRETDLDKDQRLDEGTKLAQHAIETSETDITVPAGTPQDKVDAYKGFLRSNAYYVLGTIAYTREKYADAENYFHKSLDAFPSQPDPLALLRLALSLDKQEKYSEALKFANQAVQMTESTQGTTLATLSRNERDRLVQLTGGTPSGKPPASAQNPAPKN
ncbi:MAG: tetratricopeptide repeat protein [Terriglobales bacterium]